MNEQSILKRILLACSTGTSRLFRQNVGVLWAGQATRMKNGDVLLKNPRRLSFGIPGQSDLIGWHSVVITHDMVGRKVAIFAAVEVKTPTGRPTKEQTQYQNMVRSAGGLAGIARSPEDAREILTVDINAHSE